MENAAGKVCTGFSMPFVALYHNAGEAVTYSGGMDLARGVSVELNIETTDENRFHANNGVAESAPARFKNGSVKLTVDGLLRAAENLVMGLPAPSTVAVGEKTVKIYDYGDEMQIPYVGIGYVARYMSGGEESFVPTILTKARFDQIAPNAKTQEEEIDWQTQDLNAVLSRDDTPAHNWRRIGEDQETEADAVAVIKTILNIT